MMNKAARALLSLAFLVSPALPASGRQDVVVPASFPFSFESYRLKNGLRVVLSEDTRLPLVTVAVGYGAGTLREKPGQEGIAYLLENLMFQGSENVSPLQHVGYIQKVGGELNATTAPDKALFYETLPSNQLSLALWLESDRMKSLAITPASIERTRSELVKEHQDRLASDPYLESFSQFDMLLYPDRLYGHPLIGAGPEMMGLAEADILDFHRTYYVPNNAVLCVVGNIDPARTRELVARYFETVPPGTDIPPLPRPEFKRQSDALVQYARVPDGSAGFHIGFRFFPLQSGDMDSLRIMEYLLLEGGTSRLRNRLLRRDLTARYLTGSLDERQGVAALKVFCLATNAIMVERSEKALLSEMDRLKVNPVSQDELNKAKRRYMTDYLDRLSTNLGKALFLVDATFTGTDPGAIGEGLAGPLRVTPQSVAAFASKYFTPQNRVVLEIGPQ